MPFLPLYLEQLGLTDVGEISLWAGFSLGVTPAITAFMAPLWGRLGDRYGRKIMVERSLVSFVIVMAAMAYVTRPWHVFALRAVQGLFAGYGALTLTMAADSAPKEHTAYAIGFVQTAQRLGPALGPVIGGVVAQAFGLRTAFLVTAAIYAIAAVMVMIVYDEGSVTKRTSAAPTGRVTFRNVLAFENFLVLMAVIFGLQFVDRSFGPILPLFVGELGEAGGRIAVVAGLLFSVAAASAAVGNYLCAPLLRRASAQTVIASASSVAAVGVGGYLFTTSAWWLALPTAVFGAAIGAATTAAYTAAATVIPMNARGAGFGLLTTASLVGLAVSPIVNGMLGATSIRAVFILDTVVLGALALLVSRLMIAGPLRATSSPATEEI